mgnify:CR=1 FL=1
MRALLLGTGAADIHSPERCRCANCALVRERGGRSRRTYTAALLDGELLLDCGPTVPAQLAALAPAARLSCLLVTHPDGDHFDRAAIAAVASRHAAGRLRVVGSTAVIAALRDSPAASGLDLQPIAVLETLAVGPWTVTALPARHRGAAGDSLLYLVSRNQHRLFYATDTGPLLEPARNALHGLHLDAVIAEATFGLQTSGIADLPSAHMNYPLLCDLRTDLLQAGVIAPATPFVATHLSLHFCPPYEESTAWLAERGVTVGFDGMEFGW